MVAFRTSLFRRYPATVVYLYPAQDNTFPEPNPNTPLVAGREDPTFTGTIGPDITFFGFGLDPAKLKDYWVVLEEPPAGYRFYHENSIPPADAVTLDAGEMEDGDAAQFAYNRFATPVRVLIGPLL